LKEDGYQILDEEMLDAIDEELEAMIAERVEEAKGKVEGDEDADGYDDTATIDYDPDTECDCDVNITVEIKVYDNQTGTHLDTDEYEYTIYNGYYDDFDESWSPDYNGTFDFFVEHVFHKDETLLLNAANLNLSEDDNVLVQGVEGSKYGIGFFGYAFYGENQDRLKALAIEGVTPGRESVDAGTYPLARPLFMYSDPGIMQEKPQTAAFLDFVLTFVNEEIIDVGYFPISDEALNQSRQNWLDAMEQ